MTTAATLRLRMRTKARVLRDMAAEEQHTTRSTRQADRSCKVAMKNVQKEELKLTGCEQLLSAAAAVTSAPLDVASHADPI